MSSDSREEWLSSYVDDASTRLRNRLDGCHVTVRAAGDSMALAFAVMNLVARLTPQVVLDAIPSTVNLPVFGSGSAHALAGALVRSVATDAPRSARRRFVVDAGVGQPGADLYVSANAWSMRLSAEPHGCLHGTGPAVPAAAALAVAQFTLLLLPELPGHRLGRERLFEWNLVDYARTIAPHSPTPADVAATLFGVGSVGSALVYSLLLSGARGTVTAVDHDRLSARNRFRYVLWLDDERRPKAEWVAARARGTSLEVIPCVLTAASYLERQAKPPAVAVAAVDTGIARRDITDLLARVTFNAGVEGLRFHVSRHLMGDGYACAYCQYVDTGDPMDDVGVYVQLTGLAPVRVQELLRGATLSAADLDSVVRTGRLHLSAVDDLIGGRLVDMARLRLYAQAAVRLGGEPVTVTTPYVPALAGALLTAELMKPGGGTGPYALNRRVDVDCTGLPTGYTSAPLADPSGRCLCVGPHRLKAYRTYWS